jgi:hypothetical protein
MKKSWKPSEDGKGELGKSGIQQGGRQFRNGPHPFEMLWWGREKGSDTH